ncbi:MAG: hypothetical protein KY453_12630, partial [Gemmatimonadetes bacterium]|nr:hypothetical protein [Gemmatimonadota bacterium]
MTLVALYQDWTAFALTLTLLVISSSMIGLPQRGASWAVANAVALVVVGAANLVGWALSEASRDREHSIARRSQLVLEAA